MYRYKPTEAQLSMKYAFGDVSGPILNVPGYFLRAVVSHPQQLAYGACVCMADCPTTCSPQPLKIAADNFGKEVCFRKHLENITEIILLFMLPSANCFALPGPAYVVYALPGPLGGM
jgi:hypothetical protein